MRIVAVIPARMASSRFPNKPMAMIHGMPMIGHCYCRVSQCSLLDDTYVATCDELIHDYILSIGGKSIMTSNSHQRASDRAAEAMLKIEDADGRKIDILVMVQGDEPMDTPEMISQAVNPMLKDESINIVNLMGPTEDLSEFEDPNTVKVVVGGDSKALYFSREPIPTRKKGVENVPMMKQICIIPFKRDYLIQFNNTDETSLELIESVDMLRVLENGGDVHMVLTEYPSVSVDTEEDLSRVVKLMTNDSLMHTYLRE